MAVDSVDPGVEAPLLIPEYRVRTSSLRMLRVQLGALIAISVLSVSSASRADDESDLEGLLAESVVSGASRTAETAREAPATSTTITGADLLTYGIRTLDEAILFLGMGMISERNEVGVAQYGSRGVNVPQDWMAHVLLVLDGNVVSNANVGQSFVDKMTGVPVEAVDHIELILGPGSVLYGTNALYGTINIVTHAARDIDGFRVHAETSASPNQHRSGALASPDLSRFGHQYRLGISFGKEFTLLSTPASLTVYADVLDDRLPAFEIGPQYNYDDPTDTRGPINVGPKAPAGRSDVWSGHQENVHMFVPGVYAKFGWGNLESTFRLSRVWHDQDETSQWGELNENGGGGYDGFVHGDVTYRAELNDRISLHPRLYGSHYDYVDANRSHTAWICDATATPCIQNLQLSQSQAGAGLNASIDWFANGRMNTLLGVDARVIDVHSHAETYPAAGGRKSISGRYAVTPDFGLALFGQHIAKITDEIRLNLGLRADWFEDVSHASPRAALIVDPWKGGTFKAIYSEGFRRPAAYESYYAAAGAQAAALDLHPEVMRTVEGAFEQRYGRHLAKLSVFKSWLQELIGVGTDPVSGLSQYQNTGKIESFGANLAYETGYEGWRFGLHATLSSSKRPSTENDVSAVAWQLYGRDQPVLGAPNISGNAQTSYAFGADYPTLALAAYLIGSRVAPAPIDDPALSPLVADGTIGRVPSLVQVRGTVTGNIGMVKGLSYRIAADVLTPTYNFYSVGPLGAYHDSQGRLRPDYQQLSRLTLILGLNYRL